MTRRLITLLVVGAGVGVGVYLASDSDGPANRAATCNVRVSDECLAQYPALKRYETVRFPVIREVAADGGLNFVLPRVLGDPQGIARECIEVVDWGACDIETCATRPAICAAWDAGQPIVRVRTASKFVIPDCRDVDGGWVDNHAPVDCTELDGGWRGCNVGLRTQRTGTKCLDAPSGLVRAGERVEDSL